MVLVDGGGRGRTRSDRRACALAVEVLLSDDGARDGRAPTEELHVGGPHAAVWDFHFLCKAGGLRLWLHWIIGAERM